MSERKWLRYEKNKAHVWVRVLEYAVPICSQSYHAFYLIREDPTAPRCKRCEAKLAKDGKDDAR